MPYDPNDIGGFGGIPLPPDLPMTDQAFYYALAPGGRFPGDEWFWAEIARAQQELDRHQANPSYSVPDWLQSNRSLIGALARLHQSNVRNHGGVGGTSDPYAGGTGQLYSGPAAGYGPPGGDLQGYLDRGRGQIFDFPENPRPGGIAATGNGGPGGGGGGRAPYTGPTGWVAPQVAAWSPSFQAWNPGGPPVTLRAPMPPAPTLPAPPARPAPGRPGGRGSGGAGGSAGRGGGGGGQASSGRPASSLGSGYSFLEDFLRQLGGGPRTDANAVRGDLGGRLGRGANHSGYDVERIVADLLAGSPFMAELGSVSRGPGGYYFSHLTPQVPPPHGASGGGGGGAGGDVPDWWGQLHVPSAF